MVRRSGIESATAAELRHPPPHATRLKRLRRMACLSTRPAPLAALRASLTSLEQRRRLQRRSRGCRTSHAARTRRDAALPEGGGGNEDIANVLKTTHDHIPHKDHFEKTEINQRGALKDYDQHYTNVKTEMNDVKTVNATKPPKPKR